LSNTGICCPVDFKLEIKSEGIIFAAAFALLYLKYNIAKLCGDIMWIVIGN